MPKTKKKTPARKRDRSQTISIDLAAGMRSLEKRRAAEAVTLRQRQLLAEALSTVLHSSLTALRLRRAVGDFVTEISTHLLDDSPEMIEMALRRGQCGYGFDCPGAKDGSVCAGPETHPNRKSH